MRKIHNNQRHAITRPHDNQLTMPCDEILRDLGAVTEVGFAFVPVPRRYAINCSCGNARSLNVGGTAYSGIHTLIEGTKHRNDHYSRSGTSAGSTARSMLVVVTVCFVGLSSVPPNRAVNALRLST